MTPSRFVAGLDLGQQRDYTALAIVEVMPPPPDQAPGGAGDDRPRLALRWLERYPLGTAYPDIVRQVTARLRAVPGDAKPQLAVDATGVGRPVVDLFAAVGVPVVAITLTGGSAATGHGRDWCVPKRDVLHGLLVAMQQGRFRYAASLPLAPTLVRELTSIELRVHPRTAHDSYAAWREGQHDDLVLAVALAVWLADWQASVRVTVLRRSD